MEQKRIAVTGGFGALGRAVVDRLQRDGANVIAIDRAPVPTDWKGSSIGGVDIADPAAASEIAQELSGLGINGLVNIAGGFAWETIVDGSVETWDLLYRINLRTAFVMTQAVLPLLRASGGAVVNVGAASAARAATGMGAYAAAKSGVARLTEALAEELKDDRVRVNAILPSIIDTKTNRADMPDADYSRWVTPAQVADVIAFLLSDQAVAVTGALIPVTGRVVG